MELVLDAAVKNLQEKFRIGCARSWGGGKGTWLRKQISHSAGLNTPSPKHITQVVPIARNIAFLYSLPIYKYKNNFLPVKWKFINLMTIELMACNLFLYIVWNVQCTRSFSYFFKFVKKNEY